MEVPTARVAERAREPGSRWRRRHRVRTVLVGLLVCCLLTAGTLVYLRHRLVSQIGRIDDVFIGLDDRPSVSTAPDARDALNILVVATDTAPGEEPGPSGRDRSTWIPGGRRPETILLLHVDADRRGASVIAIPQSSWVAVPGRGSDTVGTAFTDAAPSRAVETVEDLTGVRIDHLAVVDWAVFEELVDAVGGIRLTVPETVRDRRRGVTWSAGAHDLGGAEALAYVRPWSTRPGEDLDRVDRQLEVLRILIEDSLHAEMRHSPLKVYGFLSTVAGALSVDAEWSANAMTGLVFSLRNLRTAEIDYLSAPVAGVGLADGRSVTFLDRPRGRSLWEAVRDDEVDLWVAEHREPDPVAVVP